VALGRKMHHHVGLVLGNTARSAEKSHRSTRSKVVVGPAGHGLQAAQIGRVGQRVQVDEVVLAVAGYQEIGESSRR